MLEAAIDELERVDAMPPGDAREAARAAAQVKLRAAARQDHSATLAWVARLDLTVGGNAEAAAGLIEALSADGDAYSSVFTALLDGAIRVTEEGGCRRIPGPVFTSLGFLEASPTEVALQALKPRYLAMAAAVQPCLRIAAVDLLGHFVNEPDARDAVVQLLRDSDWRVRQSSESLLRFEQALPVGYSVPFRDVVIRTLSRFF